MFKLLAVVMFPLMKNHKKSAFLEGNMTKGITVIGILHNKSLCTVITSLFDAVSTLDLSLIFFYTQEI